MNRLTRWGGIRECVGRANLLTVLARRLQPYGGKFGIYAADPPFSTPIRTRKSFKIGQFGNIMSEAHHFASLAAFSDEVPCWLLFRLEGRCLQPILLNVMTWLLRGPGGRGTRPRRVRARRRTGANRRSTVRPAHDAGTLADGARDTAKRDGIAPG